MRKALISVTCLALVLCIAIPATAFGATSTKSAGSGGHYLRTTITYTPNWTGATVSTVASSATTTSSIGKTKKIWLTIKCGLLTYNCVSTGTTFTGAGASPTWYPNHKMGRPNKLQVSLTGTGLTSLYNTWSNLY